MVTDSSQDPAAARLRDIAAQHYMLLGFGLGAVIYGIYIVLFGLYVKISIETRATHRSFPAKVFSFASVIMFLLTTIYMGINASRYLYAFSVDWSFSSNGQLPIYYLRQYTRFLNIAPLYFMCALIWIADALAIYRCLIIWQMNWWVIVLPSLLLAFSIVISSINQAWFMTPTILPLHVVRIFLNLVYPVNITLSCATTGLITFKIWQQHLLSRAAGLTVHTDGFTGRLGLLTIIWIIVESTMIFTVQQIVLCILFYRDSTAQYVLHGTVVPSMGVIFVLLSIRVHEATRALPVDPSK